MEKEIKNWRIYAGLGGGFGGAYYQFNEITDKDTAESIAFEQACEIYDSYGGMHGLFNYKDAKEEDPELTEEELDEMYNEDRESWIDYYVVEDDGSEIDD